MERKERELFSSAQQRISLDIVKFLQSRKDRPYAGYQALVLRGQAGVGKETLVLETLKAQGYEPTVLRDPVTVEYVYQLAVASGGGLSRSLALVRSSPAQRQAIAPRLLPAGSASPDNDGLGSNDTDNGFVDAGRLRRAIVLKNPHLWREMNLKTLFSLFVFHRGQTTAKLTTWLAERRREARAAAKQQLDGEERETLSYGHRSLRSVREVAGLPDSFPEPILVPIFIVFTETDSPSTSKRVQQVLARGASPPLILRLDKWKEDELCALALRTHPSGLISDTDARKCARSAQGDARQLLMWADHFAEQAQERSAPDDDDAQMLLSGSTNQLGKFIKPLALVSSKTAEQTLDRCDSAVDAFQLFRSMLNRCLSLAFTVAQLEKDPRGTYIVQHNLRRLCLKGANKGSSCRSLPDCQARGVLVLGETTNGADGDLGTWLCLLDLVSKTSQFRGESFYATQREVSALNSWSILQATTCTCAYSAFSSSSSSSSSPSSSSSRSTFSSTHASRFACLPAKGWRGLASGWQLELTFPSELRHNWSSNHLLTRELAALSQLPGRFAAVSPSFQTVARRARKVRRRMALLTADPHSRSWCVAIQSLQPFDRAHPPANLLHYGLAKESLLLPWMDAY